MRSATLALLAATGAMASSQLSCIASNSADLAALSECGVSDTIKSCLDTLQSASNQDITACFTSAGCSESEAAFAAGRVVGHCDESRDAELRKRFGEMADAAAPAARAASDPQITAVPALSKRQLNGGVGSGSACFDISDVSTTFCPIETVSGSPVTQSCRDTMVQESECIGGWTCSLDRSGGAVCMEIENELGVEGIIIAIVFAVAIIGGIGTLIFLCIRDKREQKRFAAKAEAVALHRAHTKRTRAQDAKRGVLQKQQSGLAPGASPAGDPFADRQS